MCFRCKAQDEQTAQHGEPGAGEAHPRQDECRNCFSSPIEHMMSVPAFVSFPCFTLHRANLSVSNVLKGQKWNSDILTKQSKPSLAKSSSKLFLINRLRGKKYKTGSSTKVLQDTSNTLDTSQTPVQAPQKVKSTGSSDNHTHAYCSAAIIERGLFCFARC